MWVDPDSGKTWAQIAEQVWGTLPPDVQARCDARCQATGQTHAQYFQELYARGHDQFVKEANDPESELSQYFDRRDFPFGHDPWLEHRP